MDDFPLSRTSIPRWKIQIIDDLSWKKLGVRAPNPPWISRSARKPFFFRFRIRLEKKATKTPFSVDGAILPFHSSFIRTTYRERSKSKEKNNREWLTDGGWESERNFQGPGYALSGVNTFTESRFFFSPRDLPILMHRTNSPFLFASIGSPSWSIWGGM